MTLNNWMNTFFNMFGRRRNNRGFLWASLLGLGVSAVAYGLRRNGNRNIQLPIQNLMNNFQLRNAGQMSRIAAPLAEFSKELALNKKEVTNTNTKR